MNSKTFEMTPERWSKVEELFERATQLEIDARAAYLETACRGDDELRDYLLDLLQTDDTVDASVEKSIAESVSRAFENGDSQADQMKGQMIGPYRVERLIGSGGMGMVYLAERADQQFDQQVAIKLGRHRLVDPETVLRLQNERQILADLDHPNIARLFDGGTTDDGVPYIVMEFIDGIRIDEYCDTHRLNIADRLQLFETICSAVHYAHQNLIIHRDIKASNILVAGDGNPKLLDFGIAKLIDSAGEATDGLTREGAVIMTPANATPEQVLGNAITTATDVYALGLLLHGLLSGFRAYETENLSPSEFARVISEQDITKPSLRLERAGLHTLRAKTGDNAVTTEKAAHDRSTTAPRLQRQIRGDLDTIILKALRKEPERRYRSVSALADDIHLHSRSMPIVARSESWRYRAGKFVRRHYAAVSASAMVVAMLAAFAVMLSVQNRKIANERDTAREVSQFLEDIFMAPDPSRARGAEITAEEILAAGADRISTDLGERPEIQSTLMGTIGRVYHSLGEYGSSVDILEEALALQQQTHGENHLSVARAKNDLAAALTWLAEYQRAQELLESALQTNREASGPVSPEAAENLNNLANLFLRSGDTNQAEVFANLTIDTYEQLDNTYGLKLATAKATLARALQVRGDLDKTEVLLREAIDIVNSTEGPNHPAMAFYLQNLGVLLRTKGDLPAAKETLDRAVSATRRILGDKHDLLAATLVHQGVVLHLTGDLNSGEVVLQEAVSLYVETLGGDNPSVGYAKTALGMLLHDKVDVASAEPTLRDALSIFEQTLANDHQYTASALTELGAVLNTAGRPAEARNLLIRALDIRKKDYPAAHELVAATRTEYADSLTRLGFYAEAEPLLIASVDALQEKPGRRRERAYAALSRLHERIIRADGEP